MSKYKTLFFIFVRSDMVTNGLLMTHNPTCNYHMWPQVSPKTSTKHKGAFTPNAVCTAPTAGYVADRRRHKHAPHTYGTRCSATEQTRWDLENKMTASSATLASG